MPTVQVLMGITVEVNIPEDVTGEQARDIGIEAAMVSLENLPEEVFSEPIQGPNGDWKVVVATNITALLRSDKEVEAIEAAGGEFPDPKVIFSKTKIIHPPGTAKDLLDAMSGTAPKTTTVH